MRESQLLAERAGEKKKVSALENGGEHWSTSSNNNCILLYFFLYWWLLMAFIIHYTLQRIVELTINIMNIISPLSLNCKVTISQLPGLSQSSIFCVVCGVSAVSWKRKRVEKKIQW